MTEPSDAQVLAALDVLGWPDDRGGSAHVEPDGYEVCPARWYWDLVTEVARAVLDAGGGGGLDSPQGSNEPQASVQGAFDGGLARVHHIPWLPDPIYGSPEWAAMFDSAPTT